MLEYTELIKQQLHKQNKELLKCSISDERLKKDPFLAFGIGMFRYRSFMKFLIILSVFLSILTIPIIHIYGLNDVKLPTLTWTWADFSLANMGFEMMKCRFKSNYNDFIELDCPYGKITEIPAGGIGLNHFN